MTVSFGTQALVEDATGESHLCVMRGRRLRPVCGDRVAWTAGAAGGVITAIAPRHSQLLRHDRRGGARVMAANVDRMAVVCAPQPPPDGALLDRYFVGAEVLGIAPLLVINKADLLSGEPGCADSERVRREFAAIGYPVVTVSAREGSGMAALRRHLHGHTSVFVGPSGVGKSSLVNALVPDLAARTAALSAASGQGRHTTTTARLYHLPNPGGDVIDSPGVRDFRLWPMDQAALCDGFREFRACTGLCRFQNCRHVAEPGCAVKEAVRSGAIGQRRYDSYRLLLRHVVG